MQGTALGIAGAGNSGTVFAALFAPGLAAAYGWINVFGLAAIPVAITFAVYLFAAQDSPSRPPAKSWPEYIKVLRIGDAWWFMFFYSVTFGGFVGLASSLTIYFNSQYGLPPVTAGYLTAACVFAGSLVRPVGGIVADRFGGVRALSVLYVAAAAALVIVSFGLPRVWMALTGFIVGMLALGMGNGAVFQLVPQRFRQEIGITTGLVGMTGGIGGFYLASSLGHAKQLTGSYQAGLLVFAILALVAVMGLTGIKRRWRTTWGAMPGVARI
jgi:NNP family nitrate/nitrite transporter-like MFS transporter